MKCCMIADQCYRCSLGMSAARLDGQDNARTVNCSGFGDLEQQRRGLLWPFRKARRRVLSLLANAIDKPGSLVTFNKSSSKLVVAQILGIREGRTAFSVSVRLDAQ